MKHQKTSSEIILEAYEGFLMISKDTVQVITDLSEEEIDEGFDELVEMDIMEPAEMAATKCAMAMKSGVDSI